MFFETVLRNSTASITFSTNSPPAHLMRPREETRKLVAPSGVVYAGIHFSSELMGITLSFTLIIS